MKKLLTTLALVLAIVLLIQQASAIGITPGRKIIDFEPGKTQEIPFSIINNNGESTSVSLDVKGELKDSVTLNKNSIDLDPDKKKTQLNYQIELPQEIEEPGTHKAEIIATEIKDGKEGQGKVVGSQESVATQLYVEVPYEGKYLETGDIKIDGGTNSTTFYIPIINKGNKKIERASANIKISDEEGNQVAEMKTNGKPISPGTRKEIVAEVTESLQPGKYSAEIKVNYDGESTTKERNFQIGEDYMSIEKIDVNNFELGGIAKFNTVAKNGYSVEAKEAYLKMQVFDENDETMANIKSQTYNIPAKSKTTMVAYWDTEGVETGNYKGNILLDHSLGRFEKDVTFEVKENDILVQGISGQVVAEQVDSGNTKKILIIAVIVLAALNIVWFTIVRKVLKKKNKSIKSLFSKKSK